VVRVSESSDASLAGVRMAHMLSLAPAAATGDQPPTTSPPLLGVGLAATFCSRPLPVADPDESPVAAAAAARRVLGLPLLIPRMTWLRMKLRVVASCLPNDVVTMKGWAGAP